METIILVIHLILALAIIGLVLVQKSTGGGLGIGGGAGDFATARGTANALTKMTTYFALAFFCTSMTLAWMAGHRGNDSVLDALEANQATIEMPADEVEAVIEDAEPVVPTGE
jgi:preprotein translocase subunit SecG